MFNDEIVNDICYDGIEICCGFVKENDFWMSGDGVCEVDVFLYVVG